MSGRAGQTAAVAAVVLVLLAGGATAFDSSPLSQVDVETDSTTLNVGLHASGNSTWEIVYRVRLDDQNTTDAFQDLAQDVKENPSAYTGPFRDRMERTVAAAENATGRPMAVGNVSVDTRTQVEYGLLVYRFEWSRFAQVEGDTVTAGDAIDQFFIDNETTLRVTWSDGYGLQSVNPDATRTSAGEVVWQGERDFAPGEPRVVVAPGAGDSESGAGSGDGSGSAGDGSSGSGGSGGDGNAGGGFPLLPVLAVVLVAAAGLLYASREQLGPFDERQVTDGDGDGAAEVGAAGPGDDDDDGPPPELLSNEERVLHLLEDNGGRMKQKEVAEQLDWTAAKTSQVVGDLRDAEKLDSFRLGRENVLTLPDVELEPNDEES